MSNVSLPALFAALQQQLEAALNISHLHVRHPGAKGDATELDWIRMFNDHLPIRYRTEKSFVVDSKGRLSDQIDAVIFDGQYSPLVLNHAGLLYVPAESVYAVFEVKQTLNKAHVEYAGDKARSVRRLERTSVPIHHAGGVYPLELSLRLDRRAG